jgi:hypothetical protein
MKNGEKKKGAELFGNSPFLYHHAAGGFTPPD